MNEIQELNNKPTREMIERFEQSLSDLPPIDIQTRHYFVNGLYAREIHIPQGVILTGKVHLGEHLNIVSKGRIVVWTEDGMRDVSAGTTIPSYPGCKRVGWALEDTVWVTIHANVDNERDLNSLEARFIEPAQLKTLTNEMEGKLWLG